MDGEGGRRGIGERGKQGRDGDGESWGQKVRG